MTHTVAIPVNGEALTPDPLGVANWAREEALIVSDLHIEKGSSFAARGALLPPYDTRTTLTRLDADDAVRLVALTSAADWLWILGNHDPAPPARLTARGADNARNRPRTRRPLRQRRSAEGCF